MNLTKSCFAWVLFLFASQTLYAQNIHSELNAILKGMASNDFIDVIIEFKESADLSKLKGNRSAVISALLVKANQTQKNVLLFLNNEKNKGNVKQIRSFYIVNGIHTRCTKDVVEKLLTFNEIAVVYFDEVVKTGGIKFTKTSEVSNNIYSTTSSNYWWNIEKISADRVHDELGTTGSGVIVGIIDEGFSSNHPDLVPRWKSQYGW